jgi:hypothetical protein
MVLRCSLAVSSSKRPANAVKTPLAVAVNSRDASSARQGNKIAIT